MDRGVSFRIQQLPPEDFVIETGLGTIFRVIRAVPSRENHHEEVAIVTIEGRRREVEERVLRFFRTEYPGGSLRADFDFFGLTPLNRIEPTYEQEGQIVE